MSRAMWSKLPACSDSMMAERSACGGRSGQAGSLPHIIALLALALCARGDDAFTSANRAYAAGNFAEAKTGYERALVQGARANEFYNLGNACFRLGESGRAALAFERALALAPGLGEASSNLRFVRQKAGSRLVELSWPARMLGAVPPSLAPWLSIGLAWCGILWGGLSLWRRSGAGGVVGGALLLLLGAGYGAGVAWWVGHGV